MISISWIIWIHEPAITWQIDSTGWGRTVMNEQNSLRKGTQSCFKTRNLWISCMIWRWRKQMVSTRTCIQILMVSTINTTKCVTANFLLNIGFSFLFIFLARLSWYSKDKQQRQHLHSGFCVILQATCSHWQPWRVHEATSQPNCSLDSARSTNCVHRTSQLNCSSESASITGYAHKGL